MPFKVGVMLVAAGLVAIGVGAIASPSLDLALAGGWHATVFAPAVGIPLVIAGAAVLVVAALRRRATGTQPSAR